jgi:hypothetical protein
MLSAAQKRFLRDPRPYVHGAYHSPTVRTMLALQRKGLITVTAICGVGVSAYETTLTAAGRNELAKLRTEGG